MKLNLLVAIILPIFLPCMKNGEGNEKPKAAERAFENKNPYPTIGAIPPPEGYHRIAVPSNSFGQWLRNISLKADKTVYTYDGKPKRNQTAQFAVLAISVGNRDLQQCADAVMRLRAEYLYSRKNFGLIEFRDNSKKVYKLGPHTDREHFDQYLEIVFTRCGTLSLESQLKPIDPLKLQPGDVLIQGGSPGHAMLVVDMAVNSAGKTIYLLAQSYMPAQDIHIVLNPTQKLISPWYALDRQEIQTPEWVFQPGHFKTW